MGHLTMCHYLRDGTDFLGIDIAALPCCLSFVANAKGWTRRGVVDQVLVAVRRAVGIAVAYFLL